MSSPTQGEWYTVASETETIRTISRMAYGRDLSNQVVIANFDLLVKRGLSLEGLPIIYAGDKLFIPLYSNRYKNERVTADFDTQITVKLNGVTISNAVASSIGRQMNQIANGFTIAAPFDYTDNKQTDLFRPYKWQTAQLWIGDELYITALASKWDYSMDDAGVMATIECRTLPGEMLECMGMRRAQQFKPGLTLLDICREVARPYGITCYASDGSGGVVTVMQKNDDGATEFGTVEQDVDQTDADFLTNLARQKGMLLTSMPDGNLLLTRANVKDKPVAALRQGQYPVLSVASSFDGSKRFSKWMATTEAEGESSISASLQDTTVPRNRGYVFKATDADEANLSTAIKWRMAKSIADACSIPVRVAGWRNAEGELWKENTKVTLYAPGAFIFTESEMITESVTLSKDEGGGDIAELKLAIPEAYTTTMPKAPFPWDGYYRAPHKALAGELMPL